MIDWSKTQAYTGTIFQQGVYINLKGRQPYGCVDAGTAYESLRREIATRLADLRDHRTAEPLFERVYLREEIFQGPYVDRAPDILPVLKKGNGLLAPGFGNGDVVQYQDHLPIGCHEPEGIFIASGAGIRRGARLGAVSVMDITPTVLHSIGLPIPNDLDGRVLTDIFETEDLARRPVQFDGRSASQVAASAKATENGQDLSEEDTEVLVERLKGLGYL
jgi:predicted AlkP superfamily phosphohydrolase/phosphomutase